LIENPTMKKILLLVFITSTVAAQSITPTLKANYIKFLKNQAFKNNQTIQIFECKVEPYQLVSEKKYDEEQLKVVFLEWQRNDKIQKLQLESLNISKGLQKISDDRDSQNSWDSIIESDQEEIDQTNEVINALAEYTDNILKKLETYNYTKNIKKCNVFLKYTISDRTGKSNNFMDNVDVFFDSKNQVKPILLRPY